MKHLIIIDGLSFLFRAYYGVRGLTRSDGLHTNALYGFTQMLIKVINDLQPDMCTIALDSIGNTFRHDIYPEYKAHRSDMDEEMKEQMPYFEPLINSFAISNIRVEGFEADDIIASLAKQYGKTHKVTIVSSDKDLMQLINDNVSMLDTMKNKTFSYAEVEDKFGVTPAQVIDAQALIGDSSDNIPGVKGVGPKTAAQLIADYGSLDGIYAHIEEIPKVKLKEKLIDNKDNAYMSKRLVTLDQDMQLDISEQSLTFAPDLDGAVNFLEDMEFNRLAERLHKRLDKAVNGTANGRGKTASIKTEEVERVKYTTIETKEDLKAWLDKLNTCEYFAIDTETTGLDPMRAELVGISISYKEKDGAYIPLTHQGDSLLEAPIQLEKNYVIEQLKPILANPNIKKIGQNIKYDMHILLHEGLKIVNYEDTMLMSAALDAGLHGHGMDELAKLHLEHECIPFKEVCGVGKKQITFDYVDIASATRYAAEDADITLRLYNVLKAKLNSEENKTVKKVYEEVERPLIPTLLHMEEEGVFIDRTGLEKLLLEFGERLAKHEAKIYELSGETFNIGSPKQLGEVLFDRMGLPTKGKKRSTNVDVLEKFANDGYEIADEILAYRSMSKLRSTYTEALIAQINPKTNRVHTSYHQNGASTGRFSSSDPNLQNIPGRTEDGKKIRRTFVAEKGNKLLCADYSQIELRLLAHTSGSEALQRAFTEGGDIHRYTAHQIFDVPQEEVTPEQRSAAKTINFGLIYGMGQVSLAKQLGIKREEAAKYIESYFKRYSGVKESMDKYVELARETGYVETMFGRRINLPNINATHPMLKAGSERAAINAPLQGANADIIKMVMPKIEEALRAANLKAKMLLQVHDELIFEVPENELEQTSNIVRNLMENIVKLDIPLTVGIDSADNWEDAH